VGAHVIAPAGSNAISFQTEKLSSHMAAAVSGLDLNRLPDPVPWAALLGVLHDNFVVCIRDRKLAPSAFRDAMAQFGTPMRRKQLAHTPECAGVDIISSEDRDELGDGRKIVNGADWHTDDSFMREPCSLTMLYGVVVPSHPPSRPPTPITGKAVRCARNAYDSAGGSRYCRSVDCERPTNPMAVLMIGISR
jgi:alpha-ketoglutarate-dependent taurine dioxygenase